MTRYLFLVLFSFGCSTSSGSVVLPASMPGIPQQPWEWCLKLSAFETATFLNNEDMSLTPDQTACVQAKVVEECGLFFQGLANKTNINTNLLHMVEWCVEDFQNAIAKERYKTCENVGDDPLVDEVAKAVTEDLAKRIAKAVGKATMQ